MNKMMYIGVLARRYMIGITEHSRPPRPVFLLRDHNLICYVIDNEMDRTLYGDNKGKGLFEIGEKI